MSDSDGKVKIIIETNAKEAIKVLDDVSSAFNKTGQSAENVTTVFNSLQNGVNKNIEALREMALGGGQNSAEFKGLAQQTRDYKKALDEAAASVQKATGITAENDSIANKLGGTINKLAGAYLGIQGVKIVCKNVMEATEAFRTQERAVLSLNNSLQNAGVYSKSYSREIQALASEIQSYSNYGDEVIIKAQALGQSFIGQRVYPKWVTMGRMTQEKAKEEIKLMSLATACFNEILEKKAFEIQQHLFDLNQYQKQTHNEIICGRGKCRRRGYESI